MAEFVSNLDRAQTVLDHDQALLQGRAADGGVFCFNPNKSGGQYPQVSLEELRGLAGAPYTEMSKKVMVKLVDGDVPLEEQAEVIDHAYQNSNFPLAPDGKVVTVTRIDAGVQKGNISNGMTASFKDNGMAHHAANTSRAVKRSGKKMTIAGTSTGDTAPAAEFYFKGMQKIGLAVFSPEQEGASSPMQRAQMEAYAGGNIANARVKANFDQISKLVEKIKKQAGHEKLGTVNSVGIGRLLPQILTAFGTYLEAVEDNIGQEVDFIIPSGNFGDALTFYYAKRMGLPIGKIVLGNTEQNNALHNLVQHGRYEKRDSQITIASAMDIMAPANLPRLIFDMLEGNVDKMIEFTERYSKMGGVALADVGLSPNAMKEWGFDSDTVSRPQIIGCIADVYKETGIVIDPHTAVAVAVAKRRKGKTNNLMVALETAQPAKFEDISFEALGFVPPRPAHLQGIEEQAAANRHNTVVIELSEKAVKGVLAPLM